MLLGLQPQGSDGTSRLPLTSSRPGLWTTSTLEMAAQICALDMGAANKAPACKCQQQKVFCLKAELVYRIIFGLLLFTHNCIEGVFVAMFNSSGSLYFEG